MSTTDARPESNLFYQSRQRRPMLDRAEGIYLYDRDGNAYLDGSSGAMVSNIGHSNPNVLAAMKRQRDKAKQEREARKREKEARKREREARATRRATKKFARKLSRALERLLVKVLPQVLRLH